MRTVIAWISQLCSEWIAAINYCIYMTLMMLGRPKCIQLSH
jgi:hypothetical protein